MNNANDVSTLRSILNFASLDENLLEVLKEIKDDLPVEAINLISSISAQENKKDVYKKMKDKR